MADENNTPANDTLLVNVTIKGAKPLELTLFKNDSINEVFQSIEVVPEVHHHTSYNLFHQSKALSPDTLLADLLASVSQKSLQFELKPKAYTAKSILEHVTKTRDIVGLNEAETFGINSGVSKINELHLGKLPELPLAEDDTTKDSEGKESEDKEKPKQYPKPSDFEEAEINKAIDNFFGELPSDYFTPVSVVQPAVRALHLSSWNPVPLHFKTQGHLIYIVLQTFESETVHITGSTTGFFINKSSSAKFDPTPREASNSSFTLFELISKTSKNFFTQIKANNERLGKIDPITFLRPQTGFLSNPWITKAANPTPDFGKTQFEDNSQRDFNDEYQSIKDFPTATLSDRIIRERLLAKTAYEFTSNAVKGALAVLTGAIAPMNPNDERIDQIFLNNGIFYSFGVDASGFFETRGGNLAARASSNQDLQAIKFWNSVDPKGIYTLLTTIVDYAGKRVVCQSPVPGLFTSSEPKEVKNEETGETDIVDGEALTQIDYGFDENSATCKSNDDFVKALEPIRKAIHYKRVKSENGDVETVTNAEVKGMYGIDKRKYVIDLFNTTPLDVEFKDDHYKPGVEGSYPHRQLVTRMEAVQEWYSIRARELIKAEADKQGIDLSKPLEKGEEAPKIDIDESLLMFTPDSCETDSNVRALSKFIKSDLIPNFLDQFSTISNIIPSDGAYLSTALHKAGINVRYLGYIAEQVEKIIEESLESEEARIEENAKLNKIFEEKVLAKQKKMDEQLKAKAEALAKGEDLPQDEEDDEEDEDEVDADPILKSKQFQGLYEVIIQELIARASKHILRDFASSLPLALIPSLVSHYHNCLIGTSFNENPTIDIGDLGFYSEEDLSFTKLTPSSVRTKIANDVKLWYRYDLPADWDVKYIKSRQLQREIALKFGIQWQQREYFFTREAYDNSIRKASKEKKNKKNKSASPNPVEGSTVFNPNDVSLAPVIKDSIPRSTAGDQIFEAGRQSLASEDKEKREEGLGLISEAVAVYEQVYGQVHPEVAKLYATLSQLYQDLGLKREATLLSRRAVSVSERTFGLDSHDTLVALMNLAYLEVESGSVANLIKIYGLLTNIWSSVYDNQHVSIVTIITNATLYLQNVGMNKTAIKLLLKLITLSIETHGEKSYSTGFLKFRYSHVLAVEEQFKESLVQANAAYKILSEVVSNKHYLTKQARSLAEQLTAYQKVQIQNEKISKQKLKDLAAKNQAEAQIRGTNGKKSVGPKKEFESQSIDEIMAFVEGAKGTGKKKNKKNKK